MSHQFSNNLLVGSKEFRIFGVRGDALFNPKRIGWLFRDRACSACLAGYYADYEILRSTDEKSHLYLRAVHCYGLEKINGLNCFPTLFGNIGNFNIENSVYSYTNLEILIPFTGDLFVERGFPSRRGMRRTPSEPEDETRKFCFKYGEYNESFRYTNEHNDALHGASDISNPYNLVGAWPRRLSDVEAVEKFGATLLKNDLSPASFLREHPYFGTTTDVFLKIIEPAIKDAYDIAVKLDIPLKSVLWNNSSADNISHEVNISDDL